jgi:alkylation response protein AidB-like acyl-CoA dehydrogenase
MLLSGSNSPAVAAAPDHAEGPLARAQLELFRDAFCDWLTAHEAELAPLMRAYPDFGERVQMARRMRRVLFDAGWGRYGWPSRFGGLGGSILLRGIVHEELTRCGWTGPANFEHLEIIAPTLVQYADPALTAELLPRFLGGDEAWAQGFSEPEAGSDLANLRTVGRVEPTADGLQVVITGRKLWTSWALWAQWALVLVRTGTPEERHRGLTMVAVDLSQPGIEVRPIRQANGTDELAEVTFDDVRVPARQIVGEIGGGWGVAFSLLGHERGTLAWPRHCHFLSRFEQAVAVSQASDERDLGRSFVDLLGLRAVAAQGLITEASGAELGPEAAFIKLLMTRTEQDLYGLLKRVIGVTALVAPLTDDDLLLAQEYFFSKIVTVYGGSREMQLITIARHKLGLRG